MYTQSDGKVCIHPKSVNVEETQFNHSWLVYHLKMRTSSIFLYDCTEVSPFSLLFFGGNITGLVNNAGVVPQSGVGFEKCMQVGLCGGRGVKVSLILCFLVEVNFNGVMTGALMATERLGKDKGGDGGIVINVASMAGLLTGRKVVHLHDLCK